MGKRGHPPVRKVGLNNIDSRWPDPQPLKYAQHTVLSAVSSDAPSDISKSIQQVAPRPAVEVAKLPNRPSVGCDPA